jgi:hypothetical protein
MTSFTPSGTSFGSSEEPLDRVVGGVVERSEN